VFDKEAKEFRKREVTELDSAELSSIAVTSAKGSFKFVKDGEAWAQAPGEKKIDKFDPAQAQALASTACNLRAQDFATPEESSDVTGLGAPQSKVLLTKKDGGTVELLLGKPTAKGDDYFLKTNQGEVIYKVGKYSAERLMPDAKFFERQPPPPPPAPGAQPGMGAMPHGMGGPGGPGGPGGGITPEMMQQIQKQLQAQQAAGAQ
jgi:hypothetical protein